MAPAKRRERTGATEKEKWHDKTNSRHARVEPRIEAKFDGDACQWNAKHCNSVIRPLHRSLSVPGNLHIPYNLDPADQTIDTAHTMPFFNAAIRTKIHPTIPETDLRRREGRMHEQGSMDIHFHPTWHTAIPRYTGHIRGTVSENLYGNRYMLTNELSHIKVKQRTKGDPNDYRQTTMEEDPDPPREWKEAAKLRWKQSSSGMTHQPPPPFGDGDVYRAKLQKKEQIEVDKSMKEYARSTTTLRTWAANQPQHERDHNMWRTGICGYMGYRPKWKEEQDFFAKREVGKVHPLYCPKVTQYACFRQKPETPKAMRLYAPDHIFNSRKIPKRES